MTLGAWSWENTEIRSVKSAVAAFVHLGASSCILPSGTATEIKNHWNRSIWYAQATGKKQSSLLFSKQLKKYKHRSIWYAEATGKKQSSLLFSKQLKEI